MRKKCASNLINQFKICSRSVLSIRERKKWNAPIKFKWMKQNTHTYTLHTRWQWEKQKKCGLRFTNLAIAHSANCNFFVQFIHLTRMVCHLFAVLLLLVICACAPRNVTQVVSASNMRSLATTTTTKHHKQKTKIVEKPVWSAYGMALY